METRKEVIKQMGDEMKEDIFLEVTSRIQRKKGKDYGLKQTLTPPQFHFYGEALN